MGLKRIVNPEVKMVGGVLAGIAYYCKVPSWVVRLIFCIVALLTSILPAMVLYVLFWIFLPKAFVAADDFDAVTGVEKEKDFADKRQDASVVTDVNFKEMNKDDINSNEKYKL